MQTIISAVDPQNPDADVLSAAADIIRRGGLVAFPTETVYGLGGDAENRSASSKIYAAKGRPSDNPLIVHIAYISQLARITGTITPEMKALSDAFWPGPLTLVVNSNGTIPHETTGGLDTVAVRFPSHPVANALIRESGRMIAAPSANTSGRPSPTKASHVIEDLDGRVDMIIDGGSVDIGLESTIIDLTEEVPTVLRPGYITLSDICEVLGQARMDPGIMSERQDVRPKAPGMRYRHYAPKALLTIVEGPREQVLEKLTEEAAASVSDGKRTAVICSSETADYFSEDNKAFASGIRIIKIGAFENEDEIAANLFDVLRSCDSEGIERIFSESFDTKRLGDAIMNRLLKAAGHSIIRV